MDGGGVDLDRVVGFGSQSAQAGDESDLGETLSLGERADAVGLVEGELRGDERRGGLTCHFRVL